MPDQLLTTAAAGFEAALRVPLLSENHRSRRLHGHSFLAKARVALPANWASFPGAEVDELGRKLQEAVALFDYRLLNDLLEQPTDENLARLIRKRLDLPGTEHIGIQSAPNTGLDLDRNEHAHLWRRYSFAAAHRLPNVPPGHKCGRMHGHSFEVILHATIHLGARDIGLDYDHIDECWAPIHAALDHACLNDIPGLENPTSELLASWVWERLKLPELSWVTVYETTSSGAHFDGRHYRIWKELTLDSAVRIARAPAGDPRRQIHGHTYTLRLHLRAPLDEVRGWTLDFGDVKDLFTPIFNRLDHQPLHELPGLADNDPASLARWIRDEAVSRLPQLDRIDLYQTRGCGVILSWGEEGPALPI